MSAFMDYKNVNSRTFKIDTTAGEIVRSEKPNITKADFMGAFIEVDNDTCLVLTCRETDEAVVAVIIVDGTQTTLTFTKATNSFALGSTALTNVMVDQFGRELRLNQ